MAEEVRGKENTHKRKSWEASREREEVRGEKAGLEKVCRDEKREARMR